MKTTTIIIASFFVLIGLAQQPIRSTQNMPANSTSVSNCEYGDCNNGWGKWNFENGYYEGFWVNGKREGYGLYEWKTEGTYIGFFKENMLEGYGSYQNADGKIVVGMYANGMANGLAEEVENEQWNQGFYTNHTLTTPYEYQSNGLNYGCVAGDCQNGYGQFAWENGDYYTGFFKNGKMHLGSYVFANDDEYKGTYNSSGQFHGQGRFFYANGDYYGGEFSNGNFHGRGYFFSSNGNNKIGEWNHGNFVKNL